MGHWRQAFVARSFLSCILFLCSRARAFDAPTETQGPLTVTIADPGEVAALRKPIDVPVTLASSADRPLNGHLRIWVTDDWSVDGKGRQETLPFSLPPKGRKTVPIHVTPGARSHTGLYPVHARATSERYSPHAILVLNVPASAMAHASNPQQQPTLVAKNLLPLDDPKTYRVRYAPAGGHSQILPIGWTGMEPVTGTVVMVAQAERGGIRRSIGVHPPWRQGWGEAYLDYAIALARDRRSTLRFATAMRDHGAHEPPSDGVEYRVLVDEGTGFRQLFSRFSASKAWEEAQVDLSAYAGKRIHLRLLTGSGPAHDTTCDHGYWAEPRIVSDHPVKALAPDSDDTIVTKLPDDPAHALEFRFKRGPHGLLDGEFAISHPSDVRTAHESSSPVQEPLLKCQGFVVKVDDQPMGTGGWPIEKLETTTSGNRLTLKHWIDVRGQRVNVQAQVWAEQGALRVAFSMPGAKRDARGSPRFTQLGIGACSQVGKRLYAGFGNVLENPGSLQLQAGTVELATRHIGVDYANGVSLVQATDVFPDLLLVDAKTHRFALTAHNDATFSFVPTMRGAFAAARAYRDIARFRAADGVAALNGKMCLDQWHGDYRNAAQAIEAAAAYGLTEAVFVRHGWQRWGYDYRLPDVYPPSGNQDEFLAMVAASKKAGILFVPHDNYIDFYPDADGFSYDHVVFDAEHEPVKAWFNEVRQAQSYRWLPNAFQPFLMRNLNSMKAGFAPDGLFLDVFAAVPPFDFYDRTGRFHPHTETQKAWGEAFERVRRVLGVIAPTISEGGTDALIGHLAAAQSDHHGWVSPDERGAYSGWGWPATDAERVPWHDMATHRAFVLFAGGLGWRYAGGRDEAMHGYGSDDYLSLTVLGGRSPMCDSPASRRAVMTYWLLHDISKELGRSDITAHEFADGDIHRQSVTFGNARVRVNRGRRDWQVDGLTLPQYGFIADAGHVTAAIARRDGQVTGLALAPGVVFADARPVSDDVPAVRPRVLHVSSSDRRIRLRIGWELRRPLEIGYRPFLHFTNPRFAGEEHIAFHGGGAFDGELLTRPGAFETTLEATLPSDVTANDEFMVRLGLWNPSTGARAPLDGPQNNARALAGKLRVEFERGHPTVTYTPQEPQPGSTEHEARRNETGKLIDFGPVITNGTFRLVHGGTEWTLTPLPNSRPFEVILKLGELGAKTTQVMGITARSRDGKSTRALGFERSAKHRVKFRTQGDFAYGIHFSP